MRRTCPHCGIDQLVADEKLSAGLIFVKCHQCNGTVTLQGKASQLLAQLSERKLRTKKPPVPFQVPSVSLTLSPPPAPISGASPDVSSAASASKKAFSLPPVPEFLRPGKKAESTRNSAPVVTPQGEPHVESWVEAQAAAQEDVRDGARDESEILSGSEIPAIELTDPDPDEIVAPQKALLRAWAFNRIHRAHAVPLALAALCIGSGAYLVQSVRHLTASAELSPLTDRFVAEKESKADAPVVATVEPKPVNRSPAIVSRIDLPAAAAPIMTPEGASQEEAAQARTEEAPASGEKRSAKASGVVAARIVQVKTPVAVLRSGPGTAYRKLGSARAELQLLVKGQFDNWFEVRTAHGTAWIRNDLVKPLPAQMAQLEKETAR